MSEAGMSACQLDKLSHWKFLMEELIEFVLNLLLLFLFSLYSMSVLKYESCSLDLHGGKC